MMGTHAFEQALKLETERLCLDFTNTVNWHASEHPIEELPAYDDLVAWAQNVGLLTEAEAVLARAHTLREAIYRLLAASAHEHDSDAADLDLINAELPLSLAHSRLAPAPVGYGLLWKDEPDALDRMLWPVAYSAADLL